MRKKNFDLTPTRQNCSGDFGLGWKLWIILDAWVIFWWFCIVNIFQKALRWPKLKYALEEKGQRYRNSLFSFAYKSSADLKLYRSSYMFSQRWRFCSYLLNLKFSIISIQNNLKYLIIVKKKLKQKCNFKTRNYFYTSVEMLSDWAFKGR